MALTFGIHIGHMGGPLGEMRKLWEFADTMGFDWFSVSDHFQESPPRGREIDCFEAITTLTAAAVETTGVRLGALVYCVAYRNPGLHAKSLTKHWGPRGDARSGWLRGTLKDTLAMLTAFRDAGCARVNLAFREGPYDWEALHAFAEQVLPAFGARRAE